MYAAHEPWLVCSVIRAPAHTPKGCGFTPHPHPHSCGGSFGRWPINVFLSLSLSSSLPLPPLSFSLFSPLTTPKIEVARRGSQKRREGNWWNDRIKSGVGHGLVSGMRAWWGLPCSDWHSNFGGCDQPPGEPVFHRKLQLEQLKSMNQSFSHPRKFKALLSHPCPSMAINCASYQVIEAGNLETFTF